MTEIERLQHLAGLYNTTAVKEDIDDVDATPDTEESDDGGDELCQVTCGQLILIAEHALKCVKSLRTSECSLEELMALSDQVTKITHDMAEVLTKVKTDDEDITEGVVTESKEFAFVNNNTNANVKFNKMGLTPQIKHQAFDYVHDAFAAGGFSGVSLPKLSITNVKDVLDYRDERCWVFFAGDQAVAWLCPNLGEGYFIQSKKTEESYGEHND